MKLTLEPSHGNAPRITIETAHDDLDVADVMELVRAALLAYGYQPDSLRPWYEQAAGPAPADMQPTRARSGRRSSRAAGGAAPTR